MSTWNKWIFGGLGWALGGPIGGIIGFALGAVSEEGQKVLSSGASNVLPNDFSASLLVLCAAVMKADQKVMRSELEFVKSFFGEDHTRERMILFREILNQEIEIGPVCAQVRQFVDPSARLQLLHLLFGLANSDGGVSEPELNVIGQISVLIGIGQKDFESIKAMFIKNTDSAYTILEIEKSASDDELKNGYEIPSGQSPSSWTGICKRCTGEIQED